jgi:glycine oxidase|tara:strand:+ start:9327 stop:10295 length:969 start_codon:yes stop_codon:yes gene_type:complete
VTSSCDIAVIGAGVLGLSVAADLRARGRNVCVIDPGGANASSVAAGMIAPAMESLLDPFEADPEGRAAVLRAARDLWPGFAERHGIALIRDGVDWIGPDADGVIARLAVLGFAAGRTEAGVFCPEDWRIDPVAALGTLAQGIGRVDGRVAAVRVQAEGWQLTLADGAVMSARAVVLACGTTFPDLPEAARHAVDRVQAIGGRLAFTIRRLVERPARFAGGYAVPLGDGTVIGATMEAGGLVAEASDLQDALLRRAQQALGLQEIGPVEWRSGVRGATADGLPLSGEVLPGLHLALAPRRNGWLMAPALAAQTVAGIEGRQTG